MISSQKPHGNQMLDLSHEQIQSDDGLCHNHVTMIFLQSRNDSVLWTLNMNTACL